MKVPVPYDNFRVEGDKIIFTIPEPEKFDKRGLKLDLKIKTDEYISWEIANRHFILINSISKEKREEILQRVKKGGTVGEIAKEFSVENDLVVDVILFNQRRYSYLGENSI